ncbi:MAG TPA: hypothetical protein VFK80_04750 [Limnochordia bacterium]|nr:hypothetical protein [Limnochordia bacterium]
MAADPAHAVALGRQRTRLVAALADREEGFVQDGRLVSGRPVRALRAFLAERLALGFRVAGAPSSPDSGDFKVQRLG